MKIKKQFINAILLIISTYNGTTGTPLSGLLFEDLGLGLKRKLQKIHKELLAASTELTVDIAEINKKFEGKEGEENASEAEFKILFDEEITLSDEPVMISEIEKIKTTNNYDFDLIEMIAQ